MRRNRTKLVIMAICLGAYAFFGWHARYGARSFSYQESVRERLAMLKLERDRLRAERVNLEAHVKLLRAESLDADMLDESVRRMLGYARTDEIVSLRVR